MRISLLSVFLLLQILCSAAHAAWPEKTIRLIVGNSAGSAPDTFARLFADKLSASLGTPIVIENMPGATGIVAQEAVARAQADGYTLLYAISNSFVTNPYLFPKHAASIQRNFTPVATTVNQGLFLVANNDFPAKNLSDIVMAARAEPEKIVYASYGNGGFPHLAMEMLADAEKLRMTHVPYRSKAIVDVIGGTVPMVVEPAATAVPLIKAGRVRGIAYTGPKRHPALPDVPTFSETSPSVVVTGFHGVWAPNRTPRAVVVRLNQELARIAQMPDVKQKITNLNCEVLVMTPEEMEAKISSETQTWGRIIRDRNIKAD